MRTARDLFSRLCDPDELERAARDAVRGKRRRKDVAWFLFRWESELSRLRDELAAGAWRPEGFELVYIRDPKRRVIARAPFPDRVVHAALLRAMEPALLRSLVAGAFACRPGRGTHRAVLRLLELTRRHRFALHLDVRSYFASVDLAILRRLLARRIRDRRFLAVVDRVLDSGAGLLDAEGPRAWAGLDPGFPAPGRGLPVGASTSQVLAAHLYLDGLDHFVKRTLKVPGYVRYVDDLFVFGDRRADLRAWRARIRDWLQRERALRLKHPGAPVLSCHDHLDALGYRVTREGLQSRPRARQRLGRRVAVDLAAARAGRRRRGRPDLERSVASSVAAILF